MSREDFDHVTFANYKGDMDALAQTAQAIAEHQQRKIHDLESLVWAMVRSVGGKIEVHRHAVSLGKPAKWQISSNPMNDSVTYSIE